MFLLYSFIIRIYYCLIRIASIFSTKAKQLAEGRKNQLSKLKKLGIQWANHHIVMIHAASYGEYEMAKPIVEALLNHENIRILVSFHSPSGYENTHFNDQRIQKAYLPIDLLKNQAAFIKAINAIVIKYLTTTQVYI